MLEGKIGLITGLANPHSIAAGCAQVMARQGANLILTCQNEKSKKYAQPVADETGAADLLTLDITSDEALADLFKTIEARWGRLDFMIHAMAFCRKEDLHAPVYACSREGFAEAMDISCHSLLRMTQHALPLMAEGGSIITLSYYGSEKVVEHYNIMGPIKAALEANVRYLAAELGEKKIRVNAISPGPIATRAASGLDHFDALMAQAVEKAPTHQLAKIEDVGAMAAFLASDQAKAMTGGLHYVDCGYNIID